MNLLKAVLFKLVSAFLFAAMSALVRGLSEAFPVGQLVFFRSAFAILPVAVIYACRGELAQAMHTRRLLGHVGRGSISVVSMFSNFAALARLSLVETTAIQFASPLMTVALAALVLKERVGIYRWSAVAVGFVGVLVMLAPHLAAGSLLAVGATAAGAGALFALISAFCTAGTTIQTRRLTRTETTPSIVFYFSAICALAGLATLPFGWLLPSGMQLAGLVTLGMLGGLAHIFLTESYRFAPASVIAPFDYTTMIFALIVGYLAFGEVPTAIVLVGAVIVAGAGLFVIWRERRLGLKRAREAEGPPAAP